MKVLSVYDGDTITVLCIFKGRLVRWRCRLIGFDAPEMRSSDSNEKAKAVEAKQFLETMLCRYPFRGKCVGLDKYGRVLVDLKYKGRCISEWMIETGHGKWYDGGTKT